MKKNFFKKLSFVLALAMIVTALAPASGVFAAAKAPKLSAKDKYLHLDDANELNEYNFNVSNKVKGWKYLWSSANENVFEVNAKNGVVTATGVGKAKVSVVITDKDGEELNELTTNVIVRDNIKELTITNTPADNKLTVGEKNNFNRDYVTDANSSTKTSGITRWEVVGEGAVINADNGVFEASKAGEFKIIARSFQSKAKYASWLKDDVKYASYVTATAEYTVNVAASMVKAEQVDLDTFKVTFNSAVTDAATKLSVFSIVGGVEVTQTIKEVKMDTDNKVATVDLYVPFSEDTTIVARYPDMDPVQFVSANTKPESVTSIELLTKTTELAAIKTLEFALYNDKNVNIANPTLLTRVEVKTSALNSNLVGKNLQLFNVGDTTTITAVYHTYKYDTTTGTELGTLTTTGVVTCVDKSEASNGQLNAFTVVDSATVDPSFTDAKHSIAAGDSGLKLFVQLKGKKADGTTDLYTDNVPASSDFGTGTWNYSSSNESILMVDPSTGLVFPLSSGTAVVVVKYNDATVGTAAITVGATREIGTITLDSYNFALSNDNDTQDVKTVNLKVKDQLGADYDNFTTTITKTSSNVATLLTSANNGVNLKAISFNGAPNGSPLADAFAEGTYTYEVKVEDNSSHKVMKSYITINLQKPSSDNDVYYYRLETDKTEYDMKLKSDDRKEDVKVQLFGYATNGIRNTREAVTGDANFVVTVKNSDNATQTLKASGDDATISLVTVSGGSVVKAKKGTYTATVVNASGTAINATYFTVGDSQPLPVLTVKKLYTNKLVELDAVRDCFKLTVDGTEVTITDYAITATYTVGGVTTISVKELYYDQTFAVDGADGAGTGTLRLTVSANNTPIHYNYGN